MKRKETGIPLPILTLKGNPVEELLRRLYLRRKSGERVLP